MTYTLRVWVNDKLEETLESEKDQTVMARFRDIVTEWPIDWRGLRFMVDVHAVPPLPERSWMIARYQHLPERTGS